MYDYVYSTVKITQLSTILEMYNMYTKFLCYSGTGVFKDSSAQGSRQTEGQR